MIEEPKYSDFSLDDIESPNSSTISDQQQCPYCDQYISDQSLHIHLETCEVYSTLVDQNPHSFAANRLYTAIRDSRMQLYSESSMSSSSNNSYNFRDAEELKDWRSNIEIPLLDISFNKSRPISPKQVPRKSLPEKETHGRNVAACPVCFNAYDSNQFNPLVLPVCGHTVCETCLYKMEESSSIWKCPVCRACIMQNIRTLPVNYALLEIAERNYHKEYCETHNLEIVGFCKDDGILLCGICIFEHKNHDSFLLTDQRAIEIAKSKESLINKQEKHLNKLKKRWKTCVNSLNYCASDVHKAAEDHIRKLIQTEKMLINKIKQGTQSCIEQVQSLVKDKQLNQLQATMTGTIFNIQTQLKQLRNLKNSFDQSSIIQKLRISDKQNYNVPDKPPSIVNASKLTQRLRMNVNYEESILKQNFAIPE